MCAIYGLGGGPYPTDGDYVRFELAPLDEQENAGRLVEWMKEQNHQATITGRNARNLNPLIIAGGNGLQLEFAWWWLHLGNRPARFSAFNSRDDALTSRWHTPFQQRALAPATWYVEQRETFGLNGEAFGIAAITTTSEQPDGSVLLTYSLVTREAVGVAGGIHPRMPLILPQETHEDWLDPANVGDADLIGEMVAASDELSHSVKKVRRPDIGETLF